MIRDEMPADEMAEPAAHTARRRAESAPADTTSPRRQERSGSSACRTRGGLQKSNERWRSSSWAACRPAEASARPPPTSPPPWPRTESRGAPAPRTPRPRPTAHFFSTSLVYRVRRNGETPRVVQDVRRHHDQNDGRDGLTKSLSRSENIDGPPAARPPARAREAKRTNERWRSPRKTRKCRGTFK